MVKFFIVLVSLLMVSFGVVCLMGIADKKGVDKVKEKVGYSSRAEDEKEKIDNYITKFGNFAFMLIVLGFCLFVASLFL